MELDPYDCGFRPGKFVTDLVGRENGWYVLKLILNNHRGLDGCMYQRDIYSWLFDNCEDGDFFMLHGPTPDEDYPSLALCEADGNNCYVLLNRFADLIAFDNKFRVRDIEQITVH